MCCDWGYETKGEHTTSLWTDRISLTLLAVSVLSSGTKDKTETIKLCYDELQLNAH